MKLFKSSGRSTRFYLLSTMFVASAMFMTFLFSADKNLDLALSMLGLTVLIGIAECVLVNCPNCSKSWLYHAISQKSSESWLVFLEDLEECPHCGYDGNDGHKH